MILLVTFIGNTLEVFTYHEICDTRLDALARRMLSAVSGDPKRVLMPMI